MLPFFLLLLAMEAAPDQAVVPLRSGVLRGPEASESEVDLPQGGPVVIRFLKPVGPDDRAAARKAGLRLAAPVGSDAYLGWIGPGALHRARTLPGVAWIAPYPPDLRMAPEIAAVVPKDPRESIPVTIHLFAHADVQDIETRLARMGVYVRGASAGRLSHGSPGERAARVVITPSPEDLVAIRGEIARWPETLWIGLRPVYRLWNDAAAWVGQSGLAGGQATPVFDHGLYGQGQVVGVLDTGLDADTCFFRDPVHGLPPTVSGFGVGSPDPAQRKVRIVDFLWGSDNPADPTRWDSNGHGTHVAGTVAGDNFATPGARDPFDGMAPQAQLVIQDGGYGVDNCADLPAIGCPAADLTPFFNQAYQQGARIHSNSWGDRENLTPRNIYSDGSEDADAFMWAHPDFLLVFAAGNSGPSSGSVLSPSTGKNVLAVGATNHDFSAGTLASFSSQGPVADGRIKPDVTAPGVSVISAGNDFNVTTNNCGTAALSGTSMACPTVAGLGALVREYYVKGYYPSGAATPADTISPSAALVKATLIASATPMEGLAAKPPTNEQGWGRVLLDGALYFPGDSVRLFAQDVPSRFTSPGDPADVYAVQVVDGSQPLRVVLTWTDYPSTPAASINLVNDLDLTVEAPGGAVYRGNVFVNGTSQTGGSADRRNNVEGVRIENPTPGTWTLRVTPFAIPQPAQGYALVATGRLPSRGVDLERTGLTLDDSVGGDADGVLEPGEWVDLPLQLVNSGDTLATSVLGQAQSLSPYVDVIQDETSLPDIPSAAEASSGSPHLRIRMKSDLPCTEAVSLHFTYLSAQSSRQEDVTLPTGAESVFLRDDLEGATGWAHVAAESTATAGSWTLGDPEGTPFQPEDDATPSPGTRCLFTAPNPGGNEGVDDVDGGLVVARSGSYDISGHPEARLTLSRWFANRDVGEDVNDFFRLHIRQSSVSPDLPLEVLGTNTSVPAWTEVTFRVADFVTPGPTIQLKVSAADGPATGNLIEAAIDEVVFWEPFCDTYNPLPNPVSALRADRAGADVVLSWQRPPLDPSHGETTTYGVYRSSSPSGGFTLQQTLTDSSQAVTWTDPAAATAAPPFYAYWVVAANASGASEVTP